MDKPYLLDRKLVRQAFGRVAAHYDAAAVLQKEVGSRMLARLDYIKHAPLRILDAGSGTGMTGRRLQKRYPGSHLLELDWALPMLAVSRLASPWWKRILPLGMERGAHVCADVVAIPLKAGSMDLVWSNLVVQWCNDVSTALSEFHRVLNGGGLLMFSTFGPDTLKELRATFARHDHYPHVNYFADMHDLGDALVYCGFEAPVMDTERITLTYPDFASLLKDLRGMGVKNALRGRRRGLEGKSAWARIARDYEEWRKEGKLIATFEVIYGHAWKPVARVSSEYATHHKVIPVHVAP